MNAREQILTRLPRAHDSSKKPASWVSEVQYADLAGQFENALRAAKGEVLVCKTRAAAKAEIAAIFAAAGIKRVVVNDDVDLAGLQFPGIELQRPEEQADWQTICAGAEAGITGAEALLAETGSVVISSGLGRSRLASLLPPLHVVLAPATCLAPDIFAWLQSRSGTWPANIVLISGPSKTADIEQTLAIGVHGPKRLIVAIHLENA